MKRSSRNRRSGLTLIEVVLAMFIFLMSLAAISQLLNIATMHALETQNVNRASQLLQSQMNRVISGEISLSSQGETPFDDDPEFSWSMSCDQQGAAPNLWHVTMTVHHAGGMAGSEQSWNLDQFVLDPSVRGMIETSPAPGSSSSSSGTTGGGTSQSGSGGK